MFAMLFPFQPRPVLQLNIVPRLGDSLLAAPRRHLAYGVMVVTRQQRPARSVRNWPEYAACRGQEDSLFFREDNDAASTRRRSFKESRTVCLGCPVMPECLQHALTLPEEFGVWGGTHAEQRKGILARVASGETTLEWEIERCLTR